MIISSIYPKHREEKSRRDDTLLTVGFNLRKTQHTTSLQSPAGTTLCRSIQVSSLRDLVSCVAHFVRRLKPTVNKVSSLQDFPLTILLFISLLFSYSCKDNGGEEVLISEFILSVEIINKNASNIVVDNSSRSVSFEIGRSESRDDVKISFTFAEGVAMVTPKEEFDLREPVKITLVAQKREVVFSLTAVVFDALFDLSEKGWVQQTTFGELAEAITVWKSPATFNDINIVAYVVLGDVEAGVNFQVLGGTSGSRTPTQFYNDNNGEYPVVVNGSFFWYNSADGLNHNVGLIYRNGVRLAPGTRAVTRNNGTGNAEFYPTRGAFSDIGDNQFRTDWTYTAISPEATYAYPSPSPCVIGSPAPARPSATFPAGGWVLNAQTSIGAGPILIKEGEIENKWQVELWEEIDPTIRRARTAIGFTDDKRLMLFVCEGGNRTPNTPGMTFQEVAELLLEIGCIEALNLDGGGSSCMIINGQQTISPSSNGIQRSVVTAIGLK